MTKEKLQTKIETIMRWEGGQRLFNFAYSIGAAIVIWGALFKILHLPGGNTLSVHRHGHGSHHVHPDSL